MVTELEITKSDLQLEAIVLDKCLALAVNEGEEYDGEIVKLRNEIEYINKKLSICFLIERVMVESPPVRKPRTYIQDNEYEIIKTAERYYYETEKPENRKQIEIMKTGFADEWRKMQSATRKAGFKESQITDLMIEQARRYPIENLMETKRNRARCINPEHDDEHPSMDIRNNFAYCYSCQWAGDSIKVYMILNDCGFIEAVKALNV